MRFAAGRQRLLPILVVSFLSIDWAYGAEAESLQAGVVIVVTNVAPYRVPRNLTGKFCEHLGANIYNGMDAQILRNATFADYPVWTGAMTPDGITVFQSQPDQIERELRREAVGWGWPEPEIPEMLAARKDGLASFWSRAGRHEAVQVSPDTGPSGGRAQRVQFAAGAGIKQWTWLPLHRTRQYEYELFACSPDLKQLNIALRCSDSNAPSASAVIDGLSGEWAKLSGRLSVPDGSAADVPYSVVLSSDSPGQLIISHLFLRPADHINGADPDVIRLLKAAHLPLLRWPGGNFVSAYHWEDGIGPVERRPTRPNFAWGGVEPNTFGTSEFIAFCRAVGCEPMICVNGGTGTAEEAARWIEYCNGAADTPMGARRAADGHPDPFKVRHWEVGNELWGHWQAHWTTAEGYVDRYRRFVEAMRKPDPSIRLYACGAPVLWGKAWNDTLLSGAAGSIQSITDHPLIGGDVPRQTDPFDVFRDFMHVPDILESKWTSLREQMSHAGIAEPHLAITELQMFAHLKANDPGSGPERLNRDNLVTPGTLGEALYDTLIYHAAVRLQPFVELITHSATVNHGGGLRKEHERVYANPCYFANLLFSEFADARPVAIRLSTPFERAPIVLPDIQKSGGESSFGALAALAALNSRGQVLLSLVHRGTGGPIQAQIRLEGLSGSHKAFIQTLTGPAPWTANPLDHPQTIKPVASEQPLENGTLSLLLQPFSLVQARIE